MGRAIVSFLFLNFTLIKAKRGTDSDTDTYETETDTQSGKSLQLNEPEGGVIHFTISSVTQDQGYHYHTNRK